MLCSLSTLPDRAVPMVYTPLPRAVSNQSLSLVFYISFCEKGSSLNLSQNTPTAVEFAQYFLVAEKSALCVVLSFPE